jgi:hypothetical protein
MLQASSMVMEEEKEEGALELFAAAYFWDAAA